MNALHKYIRNLEKTLWIVVSLWRIFRTPEGGGEILLARSNRLWGLPSFLQNGHCVSFPGVKRLGRGLGHLPLSSSMVKERQDLYLYSLLYAFMAWHSLNFTYYPILLESLGHWSWSERIEETWKERPLLNHTQRSNKECIPSQLNEITVRTGTALHCVKAEWDQLVINRVLNHFALALDLR